jgi:hypothetical protein
MFSHWIGAFLTSFASGATSTFLTLSITGGSTRRWSIDFETAVVVGFGVAVPLSLVLLVLAKAFWRTKPGGSIAAGIATARSWGPARRGLRSFSSCPGSTARLQ